VNRRAFIGTVAGLLAAPRRPACAQPAGETARIGILDTAGIAANEANLDAFRQGLAALGHVEGRTFVIEYRSAEGRAERFPDLAAELIRLRADVIVTRGTPAALGARHATDTIPIVMAAGADPVFAGLVATLTRPGGNVTGLHRGVPPQVAGHRLRLLRELLPGLSRVAVFLDPGDVYALMAMREIEKAARALGVRLHDVGARRPEGLDRAFEAAVLDHRVDALIVVEGLLTVADLTRIVDSAAMSRLPAVYGLQEFVDAGGLMAYGPDVRDLFRRAAGYVHRILQGARPADLPVEPPAKLALMVNLRTAKALGLAIPPAVLARADQVIQ
jgi:putative ABC transport system substrate-binding protein